MSKNSPYVFLSYSHKDYERVSKLYKQMTESGIPVWLDKEALLPGQRWEVEIREAIRSAFAVVVCLSDSWVSERGYVQKELKLALDVLAEYPENHIFLIPVKLNDCKAPRSLSQLHWIDLEADGGFDQLKRSIKLKQPTQGTSDAFGRPKIKVSVSVSENIKKQLIDMGKAIPEPIETTAIIDPTSNKTVVDPEILKRLDLSQVDETRVYEIDGVFVTQFFQVGLMFGDDQGREKVDLEVVGRQRIDFFEVVGALPALDKVAIGQDILKQYRFLLDGPKGTVTLT